MADELPLRCPGCDSYVLNPENPGNMINHQRRCKGAILAERLAVLEREKQRLTLIEGALQEAVRTLADIYERVTHEVQQMIDASLRRNSTLDEYGMQELAKRAELVTRQKQLQEQLRVLSQSILAAPARPNMGGRLALEPDHMSDLAMDNLRM